MDRIYWWRGKINILKRNTNDSSYYTSEVRKELELYDVWWFPSQSNDGSANHERFERQKKKIKYRVCSKYNKVGFYTKKIENFLSIII